MRYAWFVFAALGLASPAHAQDGHAQDGKVSLPYWHLWTGNDGKSHLTKCSMTGFEQQAITKQWQRKEPGRAAVQFAINPKGDWHENPTVQWIVPLQGKFFIQAQDGTKATLEPGTLMLGEDLGTKPDAEGHRGHISGSKGDQPVALMFAQYDAKPTVGQPCHAK